MAANKEAPLYNWAHLDQNELNRLRLEFIGKFETQAKVIAEKIFDTIVPEDYLKKVHSSLDYTGYNPVTILAEFVRRAKNASAVAGNWEIKDDEGKVILTIGKGADMINDLAILVLLFTTRGSVMWKILQKIQEQWQPILKDKCTIYGIEMSKVSGKKQLKPNEITLARLAGTVPHYVMALMAKGVGKIYISMDSIKNAYGVRYPYSTLTQMFAAMVPCVGVGSELLSHCYLYSFLFDRVINPSRQINNFQDYIKEIKTYVDATHKSNLYQDNFRRWVLDAHMLVDFSGSNPVISREGAIIAGAGSEIWLTICSSSSVADANTKVEQLLKSKLQTQASGTQTPVTLGHKLAVLGPAQITKPKIPLPQVLPPGTDEPTARQSYTYAQDKLRQAITVKSQKTEASAVKALRDMRDCGYTLSEITYHFKDEVAKVMADAELDDIKDELERS